MQNIYKYKLNFFVKQVVRANIAKPLTIKIQNGFPCLWAVVESEIEPHDTVVYMVGTGTNDVDKIDVLDKKYLSTTQINGFVFHWFVG